MSTLRLHVPDARVRQLSSAPSVTGSHRRRYEPFHCKYAMGTHCTNCTNYGGYCTSAPLRAGCSKKMEQTSLADIVVSYIARLAGSSIASYKLRNHGNIRTNWVTSVDSQPTYIEVLVLLWGWHDRFIVYEVGNCKSILPSCFGFTSTWNLESSLCLLLCLADLI